MSLRQQSLGNAPRVLAYIRGFHAMLETCYTFESPRTGEERW
jgi:hypothetical protein